MSNTFSQLEKTVLGLANVLDSPATYTLTQSQALTLCLKKHYYNFICRWALCQYILSALHFHLHTSSVMPESPVRGKVWEVSGDAEVKEPMRGGVGWFRVCTHVLPQGAIRPSAELTSFLQETPPTPFIPLH